MIIKRIFIMYASWYNNYCSSVEFCILTYNQNNDRHTWTTTSILIAIVILL